MPTRIAILLISLLGLAVVISGQRASRSEHDVSWLPSRDYAPDSAAYPLDRMGERLDLMFASRGDERLELCLLFADEKFHEALDMVRIDEAGSAWIAVGLHSDYLERAAREIEVEPASATPARRSRLVKSISQQLIMLSNLYPQLPTQIRAFSLIPLVSDSLLMFDQQLQQMPAAERSKFEKTRRELEARIALMREADR